MLAERRERYARRWPEAGKGVRMAMQGRRKVSNGCHAGAEGCPRSGTGAEEGPKVHTYGVTVP